MELIAIGIIGTLSYLKSRQFVRNKLRFIDGVQKPIAPYLAGGVAAIAALPITALLPVVGGLSVIGFGLAVGLGVSAGAKDVKALPGA